MSLCARFHRVEEVLVAARRRLARRGALFFLDYDGTLTPIAERPEEARLSERALAVVRRLAADPRCRVAVVSGRRLSEVQELVGVPGLAWAGNHGLELAWPVAAPEAPGAAEGAAGAAGATHGATLGEMAGWVHPGAIGARGSLEVVARAPQLSSWPGVWVEDKRLTLTVHYRQAGPEVGPKLGELLAGIIKRRPDIELRRGKMSYEVRPRLGWDKGRAVLRLVRELAPQGGWGLFYAGDDETDDDALRAVRRLPDPSVGIMVGRGGEGPADFCLRDTGDLLEVLETLAQERPWHARGPAK